MRVLLSESASLTAREHLTVLGRDGVAVEAVTTGGLPVARFSRWCRHLHRLPSPQADPIAHLRGVAALMGSGRFDALLPTHEQAWLYAVGRRFLPTSCPVALASAEAFDRVQSKLAFAWLVDRLGLAQPEWTAVSTVAQVRAFGLPCWLKASHSTAGRGVRFVSTLTEAEATLASLGAPDGSAVIAQRSAEGTYAQIGALFEHGRLVAAHGSEVVGIGVVGIGAGGSAAARIGVHHPQVLRDVETVGRELGWHGGLTLDYLHRDGVPSYLECNARTVEPGNAAASGVDLPMLSVRLARGERMPAEPVIGRPGVRTHTALNLVVGAGERGEGRRQVIHTLTQASGWSRRGLSSDLQTPLRDDPLSIVPLAVATGRILLSPAWAARMVEQAASAYAISPAVIERVRAA